MSVIDRVRIIVLGDSGVGKTSFVHVAAHNKPIKAPGWTVGCSVEVKLHEYKEGEPGQTTYFIEFWDVGGSHNHRNARQVFYQPCDGIILVHDLTNRKSEENLRKWLHEIIARDLNSTFASSVSFDEADPENFLGATQIPILVIGTKSDLVEHKKLQSRPAIIAGQFDADELRLDCRNKKCIVPGTSNAVKLAKFYDRVIDKRYYSRRNNSYMDRFTATSPNLPSKFYSPTHQD